MSIHLNIFSKNLFMKYLCSAVVRVLDNKSLGLGSFPAVIAQPTQLLILPSGWLINGYLGKPKKVKLW